MNKLELRIRGQVEARNKRILRLRKRGSKLGEIGTLLGISKQRVHQILLKLRKGDPTIKE